MSISVENIGKQYHVGIQEPGYTTFREAVTSAVLSPWRNFKRLSGRVHADHTFWALRDVSFNVEPGEIVGIIGRNGAGKSTLLKVLSQITEPTTGRAILDGRVGSLLEVGAGFHPELTGRENVFLKGAMLGMGRRETAAKFDEIVAFAEIEKFIDTPVKRYSSGMYTRLAFSVAAHLDPEIVIVDEVLAVGDAAFQQKCIGKMGDVAHSGRTILFVSHNMAAIESLCTRGIVLNQGCCLFDGNIDDAIQQYFNTLGGPGNLGVYEADPVASGTGKQRAMITRAWLTSDGESCGGRFPMGAPVEFHLEGVCREELFSPQIAFGIENNRGVRICTLHTKCAEKNVLPASIQNHFAYSCRVPKLPLLPGTYTIRLGLAEGDELVEWLAGAIQFTVRHSDYFSNLGKVVGGLVLIDQEWAFTSSCAL